MKVIHVISGLHTGGAEAVLTQLVLADDECTHIVVSMDAGGAYREILLEYGVTVYELGMGQSIIPLGAIRKLYAVFKNERPDVVQTWMYHADLFGGLIARAAGIKGVCWGIHNSNLSKNVVSLPTRVIVNICAIVSSFIPMAIISCSRYATRTHIEKGYNKKKFNTIPNGYDTTKFKPDSTARQEVRCDLGIVQGCCLLGMVARWHPVKGHEDLFQALSMLKAESDWKLVLVGKGLTSENEHLTELLEKHSLRERCILLGNRGDIPRILNALDISIMSSVGEAFPNSVAEAMACGVPCVVTNVGDAAYIQDGTGRLVPASDPEALSGAINELLNEVMALDSPDQLEQSRTYLHEKIQSRFSVGNMVSNYINSWKAACH